MANFNELSKVVLESTYTTEDKSKIYGNKRRALNADRDEKRFKNRDITKRYSYDDYKKSLDRYHQTKKDEGDAHYAAADRDIFKNSENKHLVQQVKSIAGKNISKAKKSVHNTYNELMDERKPERSPEKVKRDERLKNIHDAIEMRKAGIKNNLTKADNVKALNKAYESVDDLRLEIYESCQYGEITKDERDLLLNSLERR